MGLSFLSAEEQNGTHDRNTQNNNKLILLEVSQNLVTSSESRPVVFNGTSSVAIPLIYSPTALPARVLQNKKHHVDR